MPSYSKAPRGLFVLLRVRSIFTPISVSPGPSSRQRPIRYAFRAGRNLPDKEFRYLRTVIVTAAVHRGFSSELAPLPLTFRHWAGVSLYTSSCDFAQTCVFGKQSIGPFLCGLFKLAHVYTLTLPRRSFSRSYGSILPNSLTKVLPFPLVFSTHLPVSVCGTVAQFSLEAFLDSSGSIASALSGSPSPLSSACLLTHASSPTGLAPALPTAGRPTPLRHPFAQTNSRGTGILTCCPSATPFGLALGPTNPTRTDLPSETLDVRGLWFSHSFRYSCQHSHFRSLHDSLRYRFDAFGTLAYCSQDASASCKPVASVGGLSPVIFSAQNH
jgi:hypothetical protein